MASNAKVNNGSLCHPYRASTTRCPIPSGYPVYYSGLGAKKGEFNLRVQSTCNEPGAAQLGCGLTVENIQNKKYCRPTTI